MKKLISVLAACSVCLIPITSFAETTDQPVPSAAPKAEMKPAKYKMMKPTAAAQKKLREEAKKYTSAQIDTSLKKLPPKYFGNDPRAIYTAIEKRLEQAEKNEFETTEQFQKRLEKQNSNPIIGKIKSEGLFALQASYVDSKYSADTSEMNVYLHLGYSQREISLSSIKIDAGSYEGTNGFGARTIVKNADHEEYAAVPSNYTDFEFPYIETTGQSIGVKFALNPNEAKIAKNDMRVLLIAKLTAPLISENQRYHSATFSSPYNGVFSDRYIHINLSEIWIYNQKTGQIYSKIARKVDPISSETTEKVSSERSIQGTDKSKER
ncbi:hypothetical protein [Geotalea sp. SG265]|uniref:hypothetical protein n=1 Tax=Geotalea sp. SG265 TaxID=2922867 RepID=UPI001FAF8022|nr:hypothetical protein [Geotalea sp. SG265]